MFKKLIPLSLLAIAFVGCENESIDSETSVELKTPEPIFRNLNNATQMISIPNKADTGSRLAESSDVEITLYSAEYITSSDSQEVGNIIIFNNQGNKQLFADFVPGISFDGTDAISYHVDDSRPSNDLDVDITNAAIDRAMATWDNIECSELGMFEVPFNGSSSGFYAALLNPFSSDEFGGSFNYVADVNHAGWLPGSFFDFLAPQGSESILGVTFTLILTIEGVPTDFDNNGKADVAFREIYYNDAFTWRDNGASVDVESIALHEAGHGLSQAHFGKAFISGVNGKNPKLQFSPRAVMNAGYFGGSLTEIEKTDNGGHCSNWANWPNN